MIDIPLLTARAGRGGGEVAEGRGLLNWLHDYVLFTWSAGGAVGAGGGRARGLDSHPTSRQSPPPPNFRGHLVDSRDNRLSFVARFWPWPRSILEMLMGPNVISYSTIEGGDYVFL